MDDLLNKVKQAIQGMGMSFGKATNSYIQNVAKPMAIGTQQIQRAFSQPNPISSIKGMSRPLIKMPTYTPSQIQGHQAIKGIGRGFLGEAKGMFQGQYGGQNFAPRPEVTFKPQNKYEEMGASGFRGLGDITAWQNMGINQALEGGLQTLGQTARINPVTRPVIAKGEQFLTYLDKLATSPPKNTLPVNKLISHEGAPDLKTVARYKADIQAGRPIEPLKVIQEGKKFGIEDGKHRFQAYKELGIKDIPVEVIPPRVPTKVGSPVVQGPTKVEVPKILSRPEVKPKVGVGQSRSAGSPPSDTSIPDQDLIGKLTQALKEAKPLRGTQEELYSKARGEKLAKLMSAREKMAGEKGFFQELGALKGDLPKVQYESIRQQFDQPSVDRLFTMVTQNKYLGDWEKVNAQVGLAKILGQKGGGVPTKGEISLLNKVFGNDFTEALLSKRTLMEKWGDLGMQLYNLPRSLMAGVGDFSGTLMQNMLFAYRHPVMTVKNFGGQLKMFASEDAFNASQEQIASRATYQKMKDAKVALTDVSPVMMQREEAYMASIAEKIPGLGKLINATGRAYTGFLNRMRADVFDQLYYDAKAMGVDVDSQAFLKSLGSFINNGTGRGSLGKFEGSANLLSQGLFSARKLVASAQMINPIWYVKADPYVRKEALKTMAAFIGGGMTIVSLADLIPGVDVSKDPTSADFGKIKIGNTRLNVFGTYQQVAVLLARLWKGYATSSTTGRKMMLGDETNPYAPTRLDLLTRFFESKEHPTLSLILSAMRGTNNIGQPFDAPVEVLNRFVPMMLADGYDLYKEHGPIGLLGTLPAILGIPTQTYGTEIPTMKTTPTGKTSVKYVPTGGIVEDVVNTVRGTPQSNIPEPQWKAFMEGREKTNELQAIKDNVEKSGEPQISGGEYVYLLNGKVESVPLNPESNIKPLNLTGNTELDKKIKSKYSSSITTAANNIVELYEQGQISANDAETRLSKINDLKIKAGGGSKKKFTFKKISYPKIKAPKLTIKRVKAKKAKKVKKYKLAVAKIKSTQLKRSATLKV